MVDVAQLVRAADCGSVGRGFEPHLPPTIFERVSEGRGSFVFSTSLDRDGRSDKVAE